MVSTVGAALKWVTPSSRSRVQMRSGSILRRHTCRPPTAVTPHVRHQPLQWNIGTVQRYAVSSPIRPCTSSERLWRYAPRWWVITPLGRPVVPLV